MLRVLAVLFPVIATAATGLLVYKGRTWFGSGAVASTIGGVLIMLAIGTLVWALTEARNDRRWLVFAGVIVLSLTGNAVSVMEVISKTYGTGFCLFLWCGSAVGSMYLERSLPR